jgi:hypothetical protein
MVRRIKASRLLLPRLADRRLRTRPAHFSSWTAEQAFEIQSQYAKKAYDAYIAEASKLGEMWVGLAREAYKPVERAVARTVA